MLGSTLFARQRIRGMMRGKAGGAGAELPDKYKSGGQQVMAKQADLDSWQEDRLAELLRRGSREVRRGGGAPIVLYRQTLEEEDGSYEEVVCTLTAGYVVEQLVTSGGVIPPSFHEQAVYSVEEYPRRLIRSSRDRFREVVELLESQV